MSLFEGEIVTPDAMVIINFANLRLLTSFINWASGEIAITVPVLREARYFLEGPIDLSGYIKKEMIIKEPISTAKEIELFRKYLEEGISGTQIHEGEASCLAVAIVNNYGLASDEKVVREEFVRVMPNNLCLTSRMIIERAGNKGYLNNQKVCQYVKGLFYL
ncbi:hypothetical protein HQ584_07350 [Patescibacteria group bacterium]|nr:hypothetical protein [Patescibacteria group bacterium]